MTEQGNTGAVEVVGESPHPFVVVGIGASAGGFDAFKKLLETIPDNSGMAYVLVQHLAPGHESHLTELLQKVTAIPVLEIPDSIKIEPNHIYIIPSNKVLIADHANLQLGPRPLKNVGNRSLIIDRFFMSLAEVHQSYSVGVILSGNASDGTEGLKAIKKFGGLTFAQDVASASYEAMPRNAAQAGTVDYVLPPDKIIPKLIELIRDRDEKVTDKSIFSQSDEELFTQILTLLRVRKGTDFTYYKQSTIRRRILRRMGLQKIEHLADYHLFLRSHKTEQNNLYQDMLIPVTSFFRDSQVFQDLSTLIFPSIVNNKKLNEPVRIWVAGCSTGEEAYSIAICLHEYLGKRQGKVQIFASDISESAITKARAGVYPESAMVSVSSKRLEEFFIKINGSFQLKKQIRDMCIFAVHNFLKDPPFGKIDFISCRNVLIYMEPYLQSKALTTFHYALNTKGTLLLGKSETINSTINLFAPQEKSRKLFFRKERSARFMIDSIPGPDYSTGKADVVQKNESTNMDFQKAADQIVLQRYAPSGVVVNDAMDIVQFRGSTAAYLEQAPGKPTHNLLKMAKAGLSFELRNLLHKAKSNRVAVIKENIVVNVNDSDRIISIEVVPLTNIIEPYYLILFHESTASISQRGELNPGQSLDERNVDLIRIKQLEQELADVREDMRSITEDQEAANEELQSANEELLSGSEELQSLNEELETSKEELQSTNEELVVVNQELIGLNEQLADARDYAESIIATIREPLMVMDKKLCIRSANISFYSTFKTNEQAIKSKLIYEIDGNKWNIPELRELLEKILPEKENLADFEVSLDDDHLGQRTMLLNAREIKRNNHDDNLILLSIEEITGRRQAEETIRKNDQKFKQLVKGLPAAVFSCDSKGKLAFYNDFAKKLWGLAPEIGKDGWSDNWDTLSADGSLLSKDELPLILSLRQGVEISGTEIIIERKDGIRFQVLAYSQPEFGLSGEITGTINTLLDITEIKNAERAIRESEKYFRKLADLMPEKVNTADANGNIIYCNQNWMQDTGKKLDELKGEGWRVLVHPDDLAEVSTKWQRSIETGSEFECELRFLDKTGEYKWHLSRAVAIKDDNGSIKMWIGTNTEIQKIKDEEQQKGDFLKMVSHELKTPITSIKGYVQLLLIMLNENEDAPLNPSTLRTSLTRIDRQVGQLTRLISEILDLSRIEESKLILQKEIFNMNALVKETVEDIQLFTLGHGIHITEEVDGDASGDKDRIRQVIINLVNNAIKYSPGNDPIEIGIHRVGKEKISVSVTDSGIGIAKSEHKRIFERFYQSGKSKRNYPGFGIGLYIANEIIHRHDGKITVESERGMGATFSFILPCVFFKRT